MGTVLHGTEGSSVNGMQRAWHSDVGYSFRTSPVAMGATLVALVCVFCAVFAGWVAPHNPFDRDR